MSRTAIDLCCDGSVSDSFHDITREDLSVDVNHSCVVVKGRLGENVAFWQNIGVNNWLLRVICEGYCLPFVKLPVGSISATLSCPVYVPPRKETAGRVSGHPCP